MLLMIQSIFHINNLIGSGKDIYSTIKIQLKCAGMSSFIIRMNIILSSRCPDPVTAETKPRVVTMEDSRGYYSKT